MFLVIFISRGLRIDNEECYVICWVANHFTTDLLPLI